MKRVSIACIVEGDGDVLAVPILLRRIVAELDPSVLLYVPPPPIRIHRNKLVKPGELERAVELASRKNEPPGAILVLVDADTDCPALLGPDLLARARRTHANTPLAVVLAKYEFEAWFLAAAESLRGKQGLPDTLVPPVNPEEIVGAKGWLRERMPRNRKYSETVDQPVLARHFDLVAARKTSSFDKLYRDVARLLSELQ